MEDFEESAVETESSASTESQSEESNEGSSEPAAQAAPKQQEETNQPFHEHPRFKELVEQKNQALAGQKALEAKLAQFEARFNQQPKAPEAPTKEQTELNALIDDLKKIDPRLAAQIEAASKASSTVQQLQQRLEGFEKSSQESQRQQDIKTAVTQINAMHEANKLSPETRALFNERLDLRYMQGKLNLQNLEQTYKEMLDGQKKYDESLRRETLKGYVPGKKADANAPASQPKGAPAKAAPQQQKWSKDPEVARQQVVSRFLKQKAAESESSPV